MEEKDKKDTMEEDMIPETSVEGERNEDKDTPGQEPPQDADEESVKDPAPEDEESQEDASEDDESDKAEEKDSEEKDSDEEASDGNSSWGRRKKRKSSHALEQENKKNAERIVELTDRYQRLMAEFENARKRNAKEQSRMYDVGAKEILVKLLPVVDNLERGLDGLGEEEKNGAFAQGIQKIYEQLISTLEEIGVKAIEAVGEEFDPEFHNAVMHAEDEEMGDNLVAEEFQKGYTFKDYVLRHSMVKVVN